LNSSIAQKNAEKKSPKRQGFRDARLFFSQLKFCWAKDGFKLKER